MMISVKFLVVAPPGTTAWPQPKPPSLAMRPMFPDCASAEVLRAKLRVLEDEGVAWADFYHYAFMRLSNLAWVGQARAAAGARP